MTSSYPALVELDVQHCNLLHPDLHYDEACLLISSTAETRVSFLAQSEECVECDLLEWITLEPDTSVPLVIKSKFPLHATLISPENRNICSFVLDFGGKGVYELNFNSTLCSDVITRQEPSDTLLPLLLLFLVYGGLCLCCVGVQRLISSEWYKRTAARICHVPELENDLGSPSTSDAPTRIFPCRRKQRVKSLDTFRGICIALMIFVNYGGGKYTMFEHSIWNGMTIADILFPSFMWIMGLSMALSMRGQLRSGVTRRQLTLKVLRRGFLLIAIGLCLNSQGHNDLPRLRIPGVLQRLGLCYMLVGVMEAAHMKLQSIQQPVARCSWLQDLCDAWPQWLVVLSFVAMHTLLTFRLTSPGCPRGYLGPGGLHQHGNYSNCTGGAAGYIDQLLLGADHMYTRPTCRKIYQTAIPYDPEGILGTLTSVLLVFLGVQAGRVMLTYINPWSRLVRWITWALVTGLVAGGLCAFAKEDGLIPVNKNLNSLSFVLASASIDFAVVSVLYFIVDYWSIWHGEPFYYAGMNSLLLYVGHELSRDMLPWRWQPLTSNQQELLAMHAWGATLWLIIAFLLYRANFFLTI